MHITQTVHTLCVYSLCCCTLCACMYTYSTHSLCVCACCVPSACAAHKQRTHTVCAGCVLSTLCACVYTYSAHSLCVCAVCVLSACAAHTHSMQLCTLSGSCGFFREWFVLHSICNKLHFEHLIGVYCTCVIDCTVHRFEHVQHMH